MWVESRVGTHDALPSLITITPMGRVPARPVRVTVMTVAPSGVWYGSP